MVNDYLCQVGEKVSPAPPLIKPGRAASLRVAVGFPLNPHSFPVGLPCLLILDARPDESVCWAKSSIYDATGRLPRVSVDVRCHYAAWPVDGPVKVCLQRHLPLDGAAVGRPKHALRGEPSSSAVEGPQNHVQRVEVETGATHGVGAVQGIARRRSVVLAPSPSRRMAPRCTSALTPHDHRAGGEHLATVDHFYPAVACSVADGMNMRAGGG